jgi:hypothetical protein
MTLTATQMFVGGATRHRQGLNLRLLFCRAANNTNGELCARRLQCDADILAECLSEPGALTPANMRITIGFLRLPTTQMENTVHPTVCNMALTAVQMFFGADTQRGQHENTTCSLRPTADNTTGEMCTRRLQSRNLEDARIQSVRRTVRNETIVQSELLSECR